MGLAADRGPAYKVTRNLEATMTDQIRITAQPDTNPNRFQFLVDRDVWSEHILFVDRANAEKGSPLALKLFDLSGVVRVEFHGRQVLVTQDGNADWTILAKEVGGVVREHIGAGETVVVEGFEPDLTDEEKLRIKVQVVVDKEINPGIAMHGGFVTILDVQGQKVFIKMGGGCQGCGSADVTLKQGVERMIRDNVPEVEAVLDSTDHASGLNPYYQPGAAPM